MEQELLQFIIVFVVGLVCGAFLLVLWNKISSGSASASGVKQEYDEYKTKVEAHFEETSQKFQNMTEQYQDLYKHLSVGATSLCRPDSVAAGLADNSGVKLTLEKQDSKAAEGSNTAEGSNSVEAPDKSPGKVTQTTPRAAEKPAAGLEKQPADGAKKEPELAKAADEKAEVEKVPGEKTAEALKGGAADATKSAS